MRVIIDCGATSNFLSWEMAKLLQLTIDAIPRYFVEYGNGQMEPSQGVCREVTLWVQGIEIKQDIFSLNLEGTNVVLGMAWLASLGDTKGNFHELTLKRSK